MSVPLASGPRGVCSSTSAAEHSAALESAKTAQAAMMLVGKEDRIMSWRLISGREHALLTLSKPNPFLPTVRSLIPSGSRRYTRRIDGDGSRGQGEDQASGA